MDEQSFALKKQEQEMLEKYGWIVHYVFETEENEFDGLANIHTHGLTEQFHHDDIQVVLPLPANVIHPVLVQIVENIKEGKHYTANKRYSDVLYGMDVSFVLVIEENRRVLRLLLPDPNGFLPFDEGCDEAYKRQLEVF